MTRALIVVDVQNDFCEGGSLAVEGGGAVAAGVSAYLGSHRGDYAVVVATRDYHRDPGAHFAEAPDYRDSWPPHCVVGTSGASFHPALDTSTIEEVFSKGERDAAYSGFEGHAPDGTTLEDYLRTRGVDGVDVVGIATDYCIRATALDATRSGFATRVLVDLAVGVGSETTERAVAEMTEAGVLVVPSR